MRAVVVVALLASLLWVPVPAVGQAPPAPSACEDQLRVLRVLAEQYGASRQRQEIEAAQAIAGLLKQVETLRAEVERLRAAVKPKEGG